ncbi:hypothetical protein INT43_003464 [Umbelopsis isabellina]|uniref:Magnesium transporter n=1 Tax=Mortierella isabellina TaxID=91625 RepID=A0A8H7PQG8_MORIS|nr:hypothetical protein INT43_003464 [Umbelopsis isabellina]
MSSSTVDLVIGVLVSLGASIMDALGLNLLKLDHVRESQRDISRQRNDCGRPLWHMGLYTYIASQLIGSTIALRVLTLHCQWVAPLGSFALIVNFILARVMVGTTITRKDVIGTFVIIASVIAIVVFGGMFNGPDPEDNISLDSLKVLFTRPVFIIYFSILNLITFTGLFFALYTRWVMAKEERRLKSKIYRRMKPKTLKKVAGLLFSLDGGMLASETLLLAKSGVKLFTLSISSQVNQFTDNTSRFIILALVVTAVLQVYCLNTGLKLSSTVIVVPIFYATYTALGLINTMVYLNELGLYPGWALALVFLGIAVLIYGVYLLSSKEDNTGASTPPAEPSIQDQDEVQELHSLSELTLTASKRTNNHQNKAEDPIDLQTADKYYQGSGSTTDGPLGIDIASLSRQSTTEASSRKRLNSISESWVSKKLPAWRRFIPNRFLARKEKSDSEDLGLTRADTGEIIEIPNSPVQPERAQFSDLSRDISSYDEMRLSTVHPSEDVRKRNIGIAASTSDTDLHTKTN